MAGHAAVRDVVSSAPKSLSTNPACYGQYRFALGFAESATQLFAGADPELDEHLAEVPLDRPRTQEEPSTDLGVRQPAAGHLRDLPLLRGQLVARLDRAPAHVFARRRQLQARAIGERVHSDRCELLMRGVKVRARVHAPLPTAQPLAVEKMRAGELRP